MAAKGTTFDNDLLKLIFNATAIANIADNAATSPLTNLYVALHTATPAAGDQTTSEISYTGYARVAVARTSSGFTVTTNSVDFAADVTFPASTGGTGGTATFASIGTAASGTGKLLYYGPISPTIAVSSGVTPKIPASGSSVTES